MKTKHLVPFLILIVNLALISCGKYPVRICPSNPHYFFYKDKPIVLITSDHHYGAIIDKDFNYVSFLEYLSSSGMNLTRIYPGGMFEPTDKYLKGNPLGPRQGRQLLPWMRSTIAGADPMLAEAGQSSYKYDLDNWNQEYFDRLKSFVRLAGEKDIIVEIPFFNGMYADCWPIMPLYHKNNIQNIGHYEAADCGLFTTNNLRNRDVMKYQQAYIKKIVLELNQFDNLIFDICDEPSLQGLENGNIAFLPDSTVTPWILSMKDAFLQAEAKLPKKHLLGQTVQNLSPDLSRESWCEWLPTEYAKPAGRALFLDYKSNKPIVDVESNYYGMSLTKNPYSVDAVRIEGWWFMLGGGAGCINLNGEYHRGQDSGGTNTKSQIVPQKKILKDFMTSFDLSGLTVFNGIANVPSDAICVGLAEEGKQYAIYLFHGSFEPEWGSHFMYNSGNYIDSLFLTSIPSGLYSLEWIEPVSGKIVSTEKINCTNGTIKLLSPSYSIDIALRIRKK